MPRFVPPRQAGDSDIVGVGDDLTTATLLTAYTQGIFPWPITGYPLLWFCPRRRAVLDFDRLHVPERLARLRRRSPLTFTLDRAFSSVIDACQASPRPDQEGTWITPALRRAYVAFHQAGHAHSVEAWDAEGNLAGGLYGVAVGGVFCGESMFHARPNASKLSLLFLIDHLKVRGATWLDTQVMTPHMEVLGAREIPRDEFLGRLEAAHGRGIRLFG